MTDTIQEKVGLTSQSNISKVLRKITNWVIWSLKREQQQLCLTERIK